MNPPRSSPNNHADQAGCPHLPPVSAFLMSSPGPTNKCSFTSAYGIPFLSTAPVLSATPFLGTNEELSIPYVFTTTFQLLAIFWNHLKYTWKNEEEEQKDRWDRGIWIGGSRLTANKNSISPLKEFPIQQEPDVQMSTLYNCFNTVIQKVYWHRDEGVAKAARGRWRRRPRNTWDKTERRGKNFWSRMGRGIPDRKTTCRKTMMRICIWNCWEEG